jgi:pyruvate dehydrogenase E2 component (dihydrolipoamide acetyltransferase)
MAEAVYLPKIGMTMEDAVLTRWLVPDGTTVSRGDPIFEMDIEKVLQEVEAEAAGILRYLVGDCVRLRPGAVVACLLAPGEEIPASLLERVASQWNEPADEYREVGVTPVVPSAAATADAAPSTAAPASQPAPASEAAPPATPTPAVSSGGRVVASPFARRLAGQLGVDLERVQGTGPHGRITEADVRALADAAPATPAAPDVTAPATEVLASAIREAESVEAGTVEAIPYSGRRRAIGERMAQSLRDSAQLTLTSEIRVDDAVRMASGLSREWRADRTVVTLTTLVIRAAARALLEHPRLNSRLDGGQIVSNEAVNIGFAADAAEGLMVPVIRDAAARPLQDVAADFVTLSRRTEANELTAFDVTDATFTVTSLESTEIDAFTPIINPPQAAILGIGRVRRQPVAVDDRIEVGQVTTLSLTIDHRISDGAPAARFLGRVAQLLERPYLLM